MFSFMPSRRPTMASRNLEIRYFLPGVSASKSGATTASGTRQLTKEAKEFKPGKKGPNATLDDFLARADLQVPEQEMGRITQLLNQLQKNNVMEKAEQLEKLVRLDRLVHVVSLEQQEKLELLDQQVL